MKKLTVNEYVEILNNFKETTEQLLTSFKSYGNGNNVLTEDQAAVIKKKLRDSKINEILN